MSRKTAKYKTMEFAPSFMALHSLAPHRGLQASYQAPEPFFSGRWVRAQVRRESQTGARDARWPHAFLILALSAGWANVRPRRCRRSVSFQRGRAIQRSSESSSIAPVPPASKGLRKLWSCAIFSWVSALMRRGNRPPPIEALDLLPAPADMPLCKHMVPLSLVWSARGSCFRSLRVC